MLDFLSLVTINNIEMAIVDRGYAKGWIKPNHRASAWARRNAIIGSALAGLSVTDPPNKTGHMVSVYEQADRIGSRRVCSIPNMKL